MGPDLGLVDRRLGRRRKYEECRTGMAFRLQARTPGAGRGGVARANGVEEAMPVTVTRAECSPRAWARAFFGTSTREDTAGSVRDGISARS